MPAITVETVLSWLDAVAPPDRAESFDSVGLLVGSATALVERILFCVDVTEDTVREAVDRQAQVILSHHPIMFGGIRRIDYAKPEGRTLCALLEARLHLIAAHTNWDKAPGGVSDSLAEALGLEAVAAAGEYVRTGRLPKPLLLDELAAHVGQTLRGPVRCYGHAQGPILRVAVGPGACGEFAKEAEAAGAQAFVVGEIKHHELLDACGRGLVVLEAGHFASEAAGMAALYNRFQSAAQQNQWDVSAWLLTQAPYKGALTALKAEQNARAQGGTHGTD